MYSKSTANSYELRLRAIGCGIVMAMKDTGAGGWGAGRAGKR
ncbi:MAG: hypothetical protein ABOK23_05840 [Candidatus Methanoperedens sp.]|nr:hypothetical protein [Candidatus Methanoperedens sp.]MCZ7396521.1 hypothetical protein [Candidatus Methanoperedens sp.]